MTSYQRSLVESHAGFRPAQPSEELHAIAAASGWSPDLAKRLLDLGIADAEAVRWARVGSPTTTDLERWATRREAALNTTLNVRLATWNDASLVADLASDSPERVGDWEVVVERDPDPFAVFQVQEDAYAVVVEDLGFGLGMVMRSTRDTLVDGRRTTVHVASGARIRRGFRGLGLSELLMEGPGPAGGRLGHWVYWYVRHANLDERWSERFLQEPGSVPDGATTELDAAARTATVTTLTDPGEGRRSDRVRTATSADLGRCCELINHVNQGRDFFLPLTPTSLASRLGDAGPSGGNAAPDAAYGTADLHVYVGDDGAIEACAGLWDRGRDLRERWHQAETGTTVVLDPAAAIDVGWATDRTDAASVLIGHLLDRTGQLGRSGLLVVDRDYPDLSAGLAPFTSSIETRKLVCNPPADESYSPHRPYLDLAYW